MGKAVKKKNFGSGQSRHWGSAAPYCPCCVYGVSGNTWFPAWHSQGTLLGRMMTWDCPNVLSQAGSPHICFLGLRECMWVEENLRCGHDQIHAASWRTDSRPELKSSPQGRPPPPFSSHQLADLRIRFSPENKDLWRHWLIFAAKKILLGICESASLLCILVLGTQSFISLAHYWVPYVSSASCWSLNTQKQKNRSSVIIFALMALRVWCQRLIGNHKWSHELLY